ncbi:MAG: PIN domain-containing protein [bacterium]
MASNNIFIDTSWFKALADPQDNFHAKALTQLQNFSQSTNFITTNFILDETHTLIRVKTDLESALNFRTLLTKLGIILKVVRVLAQDEFKAWDWFPKQWKRLSFTDCTSFAVMQRLDLKDVATFDDHFSRAGFNMLS